MNFNSWYIVTETSAIANYFQIPVCCGNHDKFTDVHLLIICVSKHITLFSISVIFF